MVSMGGSSVIYASDQHGSLLRSVLPVPCTLVRNSRELTTAAAVRGSVCFVDIDLLGKVDHRALKAPTVAVMDRSPADALAGTVRVLDAYPWLSHVVQLPLLTTPKAAEHLQVILDRLTTGRQQFMLGPNGVGRVALLNQASHRGARFKRIHEFFESHGVSERILTTIHDVSEELVMNALYNAPAEAGYFDRPRSRAEDVALPADRACEISYGIEGPTAYIRVRDTFGALQRPRLMQVLNRISGMSEVKLDESRGGAGLGMWRIFSAAMAVTVTVIPGALTDIIVAVDVKAGRRSVRPAAVHLFFGRQSHRWSGVPVLDDDLGLIEQSFTHMRSA